MALTPQQIYASMMGGSAPQQASTMPQQLGGMQPNPLLTRGSPQAGMGSGSAMAGGHPGAYGSGLQGMQDPSFSGGGLPSYGAPQGDQLGGMGGNMLGGMSAQGGNPLLSRGDSGGMFGGLNMSDLMQRLMQMMGRNQPTGVSGSGPVQANPTAPPPVLRRGGTSY